MERTDHSVSFSYKVYENKLEAIYRQYNSKQTIVLVDFDKLSELLQARLIELFEKSYENISPVINSGFVARNIQDKHIPLLEILCESKRDLKLGKVVILLAILQGYIVSESYLMTLLENQDPTEYFEDVIYITPAYDNKNKDELDSFALDFLKNNPDMAAKIFTLHNADNSTTWGEVFTADPVFQKMSSNDAWEAHSLLSIAQRLEMNFDDENLKKLKKFDFIDATFRSSYMLKEVARVYYERYHNAHSLQTRLDLEIPVYPEESDKLENSSAYKQFKDFYSYDLQALTYLVMFHGEDEAMGLFDFLNTNVISRTSIKVMNVVLDFYIKGLWNIYENLAIGLACEGYDLGGENYA